MGTQGLVAVTSGGKVKYKAVAGCDGYNAEALVKVIEERKLDSVDDIYEAAKEVGFGCVDCLVVLSEDVERFEGYKGEPIPPSYRETFSNPKWNPRWDCGEVVEYAEVELIPESCNGNTPEEVRAVSSPETEGSTPS